MNVTSGSSDTAGRDRREIARLRTEVNRHKTSDIRDLGSVDVESLRRDVLALPEEEWDRPEDFQANYNKGGALKQAAHVIFRFSDRRGSLIRYFELPRWSRWKDRLLPVMEEAVRPLGYDRHLFPRVMLAKLPPGSFIAPHVDGDRRGHVPHKIHVPLETNPQAVFFLGGERHHFEVGRAYEVDNGARHSVVNGGDTDRVHLIFEYLDAEAQAFER